MRRPAEGDPTGLREWYADGEPGHTSTDEVDPAVVAAAQLVGSRIDTRYDIKYSSRRVRARSRRSALELLVFTHDGGAPRTFGDASLLM
jgi:hypothetical protein